MLGPSPPILDSGASAHYFSTNAHLPNKHPTPCPVTVQVANQETMTSTHIAELPIPHLPPEARIVHMFPDMKSNLLAVAPFTNAGCTVTFNKEKATIQCPHRTPIHCPATPRGIWELPMAAVTHTEKDKAMATVTHSNGPADLVAFHHAALFSPAISTLHTAIKKGYLPPLPGLTEQTLKKYPPPLEATTMGHLDNRRKKT